MLNTVRSWITGHGWLVTLVAGIGWIVNDLAMRASPDSDDWDCNSGWDYATNALDPPAFFLTAAAIWAVYLAQRGRLERIGKLSALAASTGAILAGVNNPIEHCGDVELLGAILWAPALLLFVVGTFGLVVATVRAAVLPIWVAVAMAAGIVALMAAGNSVGWFILGLTWVVIAYALRSRHGAGLRGEP